MVITELREDTFFALIWAEQDGELISVDSRPSDAIALALRVNCPIYANDAVLTVAMTAASAETTAKQYLENLGEEDFGRYTM